MVSGVFAFASSDGGWNPPVAAPTGAGIVGGAAPPDAPALAAADAGAAADGAVDAAADGAPDGCPEAAPDAPAEADAAGAYVQPGAAPDEQAATVRTATTARRLRERAGRRRMSSETSIERAVGRPG